MTMLIRALKIFCKAGLKQLKAKKCHFLKDHMTFLGHRISADGVQPVEDKLLAIRQMPIPSTAKDLRSALGFFSYYHGFIPKFALLTAELSAISSAHICHLSKTGFAEIVSKSRSFS